jgi:spermidine synthase
MTSFKKRYYAGIFLVAASTLLLEITLTKIFSIIHYHYFAFLIVSTALFGYGFSGVYLSVSKWLERIPHPKVLFFSTLFFAIGIVLSYRLILATPLRMADVLGSWTQLAYLTLVYLLLAFPFFFSGLTIGALLTYFPPQINRLYFADLTGAGLGCFAIVLIIPMAGGSGTLLIAAGIAALACFCFVEKPRWLIAPAVVVAAICWSIPFSESLFPTTGHSEKRYFNESLEKGKHLYTGWSPASRIDVVTMGRETSVIWIDGGTNQSFLRKLGDEDTLGPGQSGAGIEGRPFVWKTVEIPYALVKNPSVMIIGPGGGIEVASALGYEPREVTAVELDPLITRIVLDQFADYIGHIYTRSNVTLVNEEGRSFVRRSAENYDIIQQKNNSHPMAVASGALNLSETYLLTKEAFNEYLDHLNPGGFVTIERHGGIRLLNLAVEVLKERGVKDYWKHLVLIGESSLNQVFLMKNGEFTREELDYIAQYLKQKRDKALYTPDMYSQTDDLFVRLMHEDTRQEVIRQAPFHLEAPTDDKPFMEHFYRLKTLFSGDIQNKLQDPYWAPAALTSFCVGVPTYSDLSLYVILVEAILLATVFIMVPLLKLRRSGVQTAGAWRLLGYFFALGVGFIFVEISLIQKYILFIGYPVYAVAAIIFALLIAAGAGSYVSGRFKQPIAALRFAVAAIVITTLAQTFVVPMLFQHFLSLSFSARLALSIVFILPSGFFMGMPFPIGLSWISKGFSSFVPWAWGMNGYATVIGSVLSVILALNFGFRAVLLIASVIYVLAYLALRKTPAAS